MSSWLTPTLRVLARFLIWHDYCITLILFLTYRANSQNWLAFYLLCNLRAIVKVNSRSNLLSVSKFTKYAILLDIWVSKLLYVILLTIRYHCAFGPGRDDWGVRSATQHPCTFRGGLSVRHVVPFSLRYRILHHIFQSPSRLPLKRHILHVPGKGPFGPTLLYPTSKMIQSRLQFAIDPKNLSISGNHSIESFTKLYILTDLQSSLVSALYCLFNSYLTFHFRVPFYLYSNLLLV